ncbi:hypothetical protein [Marinifilum sp.]|uniref:hypothetical protein n=1 Tax=Marinifilum sp. TaxID=2033137 RepID=UPI003BACA66D
MRFTLIILLSVVFALPVCAQRIDSIAYASSPLFESEEVFEIVLKGDVRKLFKDRRDKPKYHSFILSYELQDERYSLPVRLKTRGHFRKKRENCYTPPLLLNFDKLPNLAKTIFIGQNKLKLVTSCIHEKYVLREYLAYKIYQLITPKSFCVRLVKVTFEDTSRNKVITAKYGIILEDQNKLATRNNSSIRKQLELNPELIEKDEFLKMSVFQYLIGNTDWSIQYLHNIKIINDNEDSSLYAVPYDFDMSGIVNTPYALPAEALLLKSVRDRRYRGYCIEDMGDFESTFKTFNVLKEDIYAIYENNSLIDKTYQKRTLKYLDKFYETIWDEKISRSEFQYPCKPNGTGNIIIKGLKKLKIKSKQNSD